MQLSKPFYESLPLLYALAGGVALVVGYVLHSGWVSTGLSIGGLLAIIGGASVWLRRRDYRATRADLLRGVKDSDEPD